MDLGLLQLKSSQKETEAVTERLTVKESVSPFEVDVSEQRGTGYFLIFGSCDPLRSWRFENELLSE